MADFNVSATTVDASLSDVKLYASLLALHFEDRNPCLIKVLQNFESAFLKLVRPLACPSLFVIASSEVVGYKSEVLSEFVEFNIFIHVRVVNSEVQVRFF